MLVSGGARLLFKSSPPIVPVPGFTTFSVSFAPSSSWHVGTTGGALATATDFQNVLGNLTGLFVRGEYSIGRVEMPGLDNVRLIGVTADIAAPEPSTLVLLAGALGPCLVIALRRRRRGTAEGR